MENDFIRSSWKYLLRRIRTYRKYIRYLYKKDAAEAAKDLVVQELYEKNVNDKWTRVERLSDVDVDILEIEADKLVEIELGGYCE